MCASRSERRSEDGSAEPVTLLAGAMFGDPVSAHPAVIGACPHPDSRDEVDDHSACERRAGDDPDKCRHGPASENLRSTPAMQRRAWRLHENDTEGTPFRGLADRRPGPLRVFRRGVQTAGPTDVRRQSSQRKYRIGNDSDLPMIRALGLPHFGQTSRCGAATFDTPPRAFGRRSAWTESGCIVMDRPQRQTRMVCCTLRDTRDGNRQAGTPLGRLDADPRHIVTERQTSTAHHIGEDTQSVPLLHTFRGNYLKWHGCRLTIWSIHCACRHRGDGVDPCKPLIPLWLSGNCAADSGLTIRLSMKNSIMRSGLMPLCPRSGPT